MPVRLCFENKQILSFNSYTEEKKNTAIVLNSYFFHLILIVHCLFTFHYANKYNMSAFQRKSSLTPQPQNSTK